MSDNLAPVATTPTLADTEMSSAMQAVISAPTAAAKEQALQSLELLAEARSRGQEMSKTQASLEAANREAVLRATEAKTPQARSAALAAIEATRNVMIADRPDGVEDADGSAEAFAAPAGPHEYTATPAALQAITNEAAFGELKTAAATAGIPAPFFSAALENGVRNRGLLSDAPGYERAIAKAKEVVARVHGEAAPAVIKDAVSYFEHVQPHLGFDAVKLLCVDPVAIGQASLMWRSGTRSRGK